MSHYSIGASVYTHKGKKITSIVSNARADNYLQNLDPENDTKPGLVPASYANRPDQISNIFLNDPQQLWFLCLISTKYDVFEDFGVNSRIRLPK